MVGRPQVTPKNAGHATASIRMDDMLAASCTNFRALACPSLMDNMLRQADLIRNQGVFYALATGDFKAPQVAIRDVVVVAASGTTGADGSTEWPEIVAPWRGTTRG